MNKQQQADRMQIKRMDRGFTLIELMIVVVIIAIIAAIAYPSYRETVLKSHRSDAQSGLLACAIAQERWFTTNTAYADQTAVDSNCTGVPGGNNSMCPCKNTNDGYYSIAVTSSSSTQFTATATPTSKAGQDDDADKCKSFSIDQAGTKAAIDASDNDNTETCWNG